MNRADVRTPKIRPLKIGLLVLASVTFGHLGFRPLNGMSALAALAYSLACGLQALDLTLALCRERAREESRS